MRRQRSCSADRRRHPRCPADPVHAGPGAPRAGIDTEVDISDQFGYPANSGGDRRCHQCQPPSHRRRVITGDNEYTNNQPTRFQISGTLGVYLDLRHDRQWFDNDTKTITTHDGSSLTDVLAMFDPDGRSPDFPASESPAANGTTYAVDGPAVPDPPRLYDTQYVSEIYVRRPDLSQAAASHWGEWPPPGGALVLWGDPTCRGTSGGCPGRQGQAAYNRIDESGARI